MKHRRTIRTVVAVCTIGLAATGYAQPDPHEAGKKANPANQDAAAMLKAQEAENLRLARMTPAERAATIHQMMQTMLRASLVRAGFADKTLQDTILRFVVTQEKARKPVRVAAHKVEMTLEPHDQPVNAAFVQTYLNDYLAAVEDAKVEREMVTQTLDQKIGFSKRPKLQAWLIVNGVIGDAAWFTGDITILGMMAGASLAEFQAPPNAVGAAGAADAVPGGAAAGAAVPNAVPAPAPGEPVAPDGGVVVVVPPPATNGARR
ncbi:MAG: hypothetical protein JOZ57_13055 [Abitibacteriaceae bacterium]|nr:hypothetical protein [Abditibacteriaceae bacterium]